MGPLLTIDFCFFVYDLWPFNCVLGLLCVIYILVHYNSLTVHDSFMQFYRNVYYVKMMYCTKK